MVGFGLAVLGGAMKGWGAGQLEEIKQQREAKLKLLDQQFTASENEKSRAVQREQIAATERQTASQQALQERLANLEQAGASTRQEKQITSTEKIAGQQEEGQNTRLEKTIGSEEKRSQAQIDAAKALEQMRIDAANQLQVKPEVTADGKTVLMGPGGKLWDMPIDPHTGKPLELATTSTDTDDMKNYKFMISVGVKPDEARRVAFSSKNADPSLLYTSLVETFTKAQTTFGVADDETAANADKWAKQILNNAGLQLPGTTSAAPGAAPGATPAPAAGTNGGGDATAPSMATQPTAKIQPLPAGVSRDQMIANAKAAVAKKGLAAVVKTLATYGISQAEAGL